MTPLQSTGRMETILLSKKSYQLGVVGSWWQPSYAWLDCPLIWRLASWLMVRLAFKSVFAKVSSQEYWAVLHHTLLTTGFLNDTLHILILFSKNRGNSCLHSAPPKLLAQQTITSHCGRRAGPVGSTLVFKRGGHLSYFHHKKNRSKSLWNWHHWHR